MHGAEKHPHTPTLHTPPLPSPHHRATPNPSPTFTLARRFREQVTSQLLSDPQLGAARSRISLHLFFRSSQRTSGHHLHDLLRAARAHRHAWRACAFPFQTAKSALHDAIFERMKRDDRDSRAALERLDGIADEGIESDQLFVRSDSQRLKGERCRIDVVRLRALYTANDVRQLRRRLDRPRPDDCSCDLPRLRLFTVLS